ncbi:sterol 14 desaturase [Micractinium conductrix]|uniref:Sterol 14 desaturase n=1 Tax=Micractinium conductrix TaxID=554055 RepID=A0A2P6V2Q0_9CHLO|nr:sterol 14 desaturase [Micractinium conductrix]|eukprot:PSC68351.1 sterol 14 desaturase [Micractinium conductrix]
MVDASNLAEGLQALPLPLLVASATGVVLLALIALRVLGNTFHGKAPPVEEGLPFIGGLIKFSKGPLPLMTEMYAKHGEVFTIPLLHKRMTFLVGPHVSPHFFNATDDKMSQTEVYDFNVPTFGKGVVYDVDQRVRSEQFRFVADALRTAKLRTYVPAFKQEAEDYVSKWGDEGVIDFMQTFSDLIILTASRTLLGREIRESMFKEVADLYHDLDDGMRPISVIFPYLPTEFHCKRDAARDALHAIFAKVINSRRASGVKEDDMLQVLMDSRYKNVYGGRGTTDAEVTGLLIALLFAGQHTSSVTSSWTGYRMLANRKWFEAAQEEQRQVMREHGDKIDMDVLNSMNQLHLNIREALRMNPPLIMVMRYSKEPFSVTTSDGKHYVVPKNHIVACSPTFSHRLPHVYKQPDEYQPDRYAPPREEDKPMPFIDLGFGGGRHGCMGQSFAYLQIKTIWSVLLRNFDFQMIDPLPEADYTSMVIMPKPCRVRFVRKKLQI